MGNGIEIWGIPEVLEKFEIESPIQVIDYLGMMGDAVDNIPGIPGVGDKTAKKLIMLCYIFNRKSTVSTLSA